MFRSAILLEHSTLDFLNIHFEGLGATMCLVRKVVVVGTFLVDPLGYTHLRKMVENDFDMQKWTKQFGERILFALV